jgi:hypothetical protein
VACRGRRPYLSGVAPRSRSPVRPAEERRCPGPRSAGRGAPLPRPPFGWQRSAAAQAPVRLGSGSGWCFELRIGRRVAPGEGLGATRGLMGLVICPFAHVVDGSGADGAR